MKKLLFVLAAVCFAAGSSHAAGTPLKVVTTQAIFADLVKEVGKENVEVYAVASPKFNVHFVQPRPSDVRKVSKADLYMSAGLDLEAWSDPLLEAAGKPELFRGAARHLDMSRGITLLKIPAGNLSRSEGDLHLFGNPHFYLDPRNGKIMVLMIAEKLKETDPANADFYKKNAAEFLAKLEAKLVEWKSVCAHCAGKEIVSYHDDIVYFASFLELDSHLFLEPKPGIPPTAKHLSAIEADAKVHDVRAIVLPTYYSKAAAEHMAQKIGAKVVLICQNAGELPDTETFIGFFDANVNSISQALQ